MGFSCSDFYDEIMRVLGIAELDGGDTVEDAKDRCLAKIESLEISEDLLTDILAKPELAVSAAAAFTMAERMLKANPQLGGPIVLVEDGDRDDAKAWFVGITGAGLDHVIVVYLAEPNAIVARDKHDKWKGLP